MTFFAASRAFTAAVFFAGAGLLSLQQSAYGRPGQRLQQIQHTIQNSHLFRGASLATSEHWADSYWTATPYDDGDAVFSVYLENGIAAAETLELRYPSSDISFERDSNTGLRIISGVWGSEIAQDFTASRYTDEIEGAHGSMTNRFYLGEIYGYQVSALPGSGDGRVIYTFSVQSHGRWEAAKNAKRFCLENPSHEGCSG